MKVKCAVRGQRLIRMDRDKLQKGSRGVNALTFTFDEEWAGPAADSNGQGQIAEGKPGRERSDFYF